MKEETVVRPMIKEDGPYIFSTWLRHYKFSSEFAKRITSTIYFDRHHRVVSRILAKPNTQIRVVCPKNDADVVLGYLVFETYDEGPIIHFIYVKRAFRKMGLAHLLVDGVGLEKAAFTHWTDDSRWITKRFPDMIYDPYAL